MPPQCCEKKAEIKGQKLFTLQAYQIGRIKSLRATAKAYNILYNSLAYQAFGYPLCDQLGQYN